MARIVHNLHKHHTLTLSTDRGDGELILIGKGRYAYLWAGRNAGKGEGCVTASGPTSLRRLAESILKNVPKARTKGRAVRGK